VGGGDGKKGGGVQDIKRFAPSKGLTLKKQRREGIWEGKKTKDEKVGNAKEKRWKKTPPEKKDGTPVAGKGDWSDEEGRSQNTRKKEKNQKQVLKKKHVAGTEKRRKKKRGGFEARPGKWVQQ